MFVPVGRLWIRARSLAVLLGSAALAACGGAAAVATTHGSGTTARFAISPTSTGPVNPRAVPLGDGYVSTTPRVGYVDSCATQFGGAGGAQVNGPWIDSETRTWDYRTKLAVSGAVRWPAASYRIRISHGKRVIVSNDLPIDHTTGVFPISTTDPAFRYDHNPNRIRAHHLEWVVPLNPKPASTRSCTPLGAIGVLDDGVVLYNALDGEGRDAGAHEVLDRCGGHPDPSSTYHHHDVPACILSKAQNGRATLVGFAFDGYGIYVVKTARGTLATNTQLDACHGVTSRVHWNGRMRRIYHYVATLEYPYTIGCFRGTPMISPGP